MSGVDLSLVRFAGPVDFGAPDDSPVRFLFVVFSPRISRRRTSRSCPRSLAS